MNFIPETIIRALCWTLLHSLWQGLILAIVAGAVMLLTKRAPSSTRYGLLGLLVISFLAVSGYTFFRELGSPETATPPIALQRTLVNGTGGMSQLSAPDQPAQASGLEQLVQYFNKHA